MARQSERSEKTRAKIVAAVIHVLVERGYAAASTTRIVEQAGVSRGAMLHHFPSKTLLMQEVLRHVLEAREQAFHRAMAAADAEDPVSAVLDAFWAAVGAEDAYLPWIELTVAARTDPALREVLVAAAHDIEAVVVDNYRRIFAVPEDDPRIALLPALGMATLQGLAMRELVHKTPERTEAVLAVLKGFAKQQLEAILRQA